MFPSPCTSVRCETSRRADCAIGFPSSELAHTVAATSPTSKATGPAESAPLGVKPPAVRGVSMQKLPTSRSKAMAELGESGTGAVSLASCSPRLNVFTPAGGGATAVPTCVCQAALRHFGTMPVGWPFFGMKVSGVTFSASLSASGAMSPRRKRHTLARSEACPSGSLPTSK